MTPLPVLIAELWAASTAEQRCPFLYRSDGSAPVCKSTERDRILPERPYYRHHAPDHMSLQLWCLAGPERWPLCIYYPEALKKKQQQH